MRHRLFPFALISLLPACGPAQQTGAQLGNDLHDNVYETSDKIEKWVKPTPKLPNQPVPESYCYHVLYDILCYRQPMPGWEARLVGYQGTNAQPPAPAVMQPLPVPAVDHGAPPSVRVGHTQPIFVTPPPEVKAQPSDVPTVEDTSQQAAPDPALAPEL